MINLFKCLAFFAIFSFNPLYAQITCQDSALIIPDAVCTLEFDPVCGCNGVTYGNACEALYFNGVNSWVNGVCAGNDCSGLQVGFQSFAITHSTSFAFSDQTTLLNGQVSTYSWDFGDGTLSSEQNPIHQYASPGNYIVCLTVKATGANGQICEGTACKNVTVTQDCFDNCAYEFLYELNGTSLHAEFDFGDVDPPFFFYVDWSLDGGTATGSGLDFLYLFNEPGTHILCATYPTGDFTPETCTVCRVIEVVTPCVDSSQIDLTEACPLISIPVCGCDGVTYDNSCNAYYYGGLTSWKPGFCGSICNNLLLDFMGENTGGSPTMWTFQEESVFPGGNITSWFWDFGNGETSMEEAPMLDFQTPGEYEVCLNASGQFADGTQCGGTVCKKITVAGSLCPDPSVIDPTVLCPAVYEPVCGCDGVTYPNECVALYYNGITSWTPGICPNQCLETEKIDTSVACLDIYDPVCGCDDVTYDNECYAVYYAGVRSWSKGECCESKECEALFSFEIGSGNTILIHNQSTNAEASFLTFGDGSPAHAGVFDTLTHTFPASGSYQMCLEISNFAGSCSDTYCSIVNLTSKTSTPLSDALQVEISPNPAQNQARVRVSNANLNAATLIDIFGKTVWQKNLSGTQFELETANLASGIYLLNIATDQGMLVRKLVVSH